MIHKIFEYIDVLHHLQIPGIELNFHYHISRFTEFYGWTQIIYMLLVLFNRLLHYYRPTIFFFVFFHSFSEKLFSGIFLHFEHQHEFLRIQSTEKKVLSSSQFNVLCSGCNEIFIEFKQFFNVVLRQMANWPTSKRFIMYSQDEYK